MNGGAHQDAISYLEKVIFEPFLTPEQRLKSHLYLGLAYGETGKIAQSNSLLKEVVNNLACTLDEQQRANAQLSKNIS